MNRTARYRRAEVAARGPLRMESSAGALVLDTLLAGAVVLGLAAAWALARVLGVIQ